MQLANIYDGLNEGTASVMVTLGQARTIMINLMGEVKVPGTYRLSSFSNVLHALYAAGGITEIGSLREIWVIRNNKRVADIDIYDIIINGESANNVRLEDNDVIIVPQYRNLVHIDGYVRRAMDYEAKSGQSVIDMVSYAGGLSRPAYPE